MRKANTNDLFNVVRLIEELGLKNEIFNAQKGDNVDVERVGYELIYDIVCKAIEPKFQKRIYDCLCEPFEISSEEVGLLPITEVIEKFFECFDLKNLLNFIRRAMK